MNLAADCRLRFRDFWWGIPNPGWAVWVWDGSRSFQDPCPNQPGFLVFLWM